MSCNCVFKDPYLDVHARGHFRAQLNRTVAQLQTGDTCLHGKEKLLQSFPFIDAVFTFCRRHALKLEKNFCLRHLLTIDLIVRCLLLLGFLLADVSSRFCISLSACEQTLYFILHLTTVFIGILYYLVKGVRPIFKVFREKALWKLRLGLK